MCNRYTPPAALEIEREWHVGNRNPLRWWDDVLFPRGQGPFIRRTRDDPGYSRELVFMGLPSGFKRCEVIAALQDVEHDKPFVAARAGATVTALDTQTAVVTVAVTGNEPVGQCFGLVIE